MAKIVTKLNLNKTPQQIENNSLTFAKNIKLLKDASLSADSSFEQIFDSHVDNMLEEDLRKGYVGHIVGVNNAVYFFMDVNHTDNNANVKIYKFYEEDKTLELIECGWSYSGGKITGCSTINNTGEEILTICEYFDDDDENKINVPIKHINIARCNINDNESIYTQHPDLPISNLFLTGSYTCNIPNGVYQFFIRYKIRKDFYTPWIPCSKECYAGTQEITNTIQGQIRNINLHKDSANSFIFRLHHCFTNIDWYESCQLGFILSHDDAAVARSWKHFPIDSNEDIEIYFDYDKNSIEEIDIDDLTKTNFELFNVKNVCYYKNKEYIANYEETDFNPDLQSIADEVDCTLNFLPLDDDDKININAGNDIIEIDYPENGYITDEDLSQLSQPITIQDLLGNDCISEVDTDENSEHSIDAVWKVKARFYYNYSTTKYCVWYWSKGEPKIDYTDENNISYKNKYDFTYYDSDSKIEYNTIDDTSQALELLHKNGNVYTTYYSAGQSDSAPMRHRLATNLDNHDVDLMWYWAIGGYATGQNETYDDSRLQTWYRKRGGTASNYKNDPIDVITGQSTSGANIKNTNASRIDPTDSSDSWFAIGNLYKTFYSKDLGTTNNKYSIGDRIASQINPFTGLNGIDTWKRQLKYIFELNYPKCLIKRSYYYLAGISEPFYIDGDETWGVDNDDNLHGKKVDDIDAYINNIRTTILSKVVAIDVFGNCYAKVDETGTLSPDNVKVITQFGVEYIKFNYKVDVGSMNHGTDTDDLDGSDPAEVNTLNFTLSTTYIEYSKSYTIKCKKEIKEINKNYDYPTLMPFTEYEFYVHFVKQNGIATNGYKIGNGSYSYNQYPLLGIIYPIFSGFDNLPDGYTSVFFSYVKTKNNIVKCFNHRYADGYHYVDCLECDLLLYNLDKNIIVFKEDNFDVDNPVTNNAEYFSSGGTKYLPLFGNCGVLRWQGDAPTDQNPLTDDYFIYIKNDGSNNEYKKLVKLTPYLLTASEQDVSSLLDVYDVAAYISNLNSPAHICGIKKLSHLSDIYYVTGNDIYNKTATGSEITVAVNSSLFANIPNRMFYLPSNYNLNYINLSSDITPQIRKPTDDSNIDIIKQIVSYTQSLTSSSIAEHPSMYKDYPRKYYVPYEDEHITIFNNTIRSSDVNTDELYRHIYTFESDDYYNVPTNRGIIINLFQLSDFVYVHCQHALFKFTGSNSLHSDSGKVELKEGDVFDTGIKEVFDSQFGHAGLMKKSQCCVTFTAYFFYDAYAKIIYAYGGETQLSNISDPIRKLLDDYKQDDIKFVADENNDRVFVNLVKNSVKKVDRYVPYDVSISFKGNPIARWNDRREFESVLIAEIYEHNRQHFIDANVTRDMFKESVDYLYDIIMIYIYSNYTISQLIDQYAELWNNTYPYAWGIVDPNSYYTFELLFGSGKRISIERRLKITQVEVPDFSNICLSYHFKNKGYISIHDFDFIEGFGTRMYTYFVNQKYLPVEEKYGWEINRIDRDIARYTCYNGAYKPSDIGMPEYDNFTEPTDRNIRGKYDSLENQLDEDSHQIVPSVIDIILNGDYEKIKSLEYVNWISSVIEDYGFSVVNYAEEVLNRNYSATKLRIYSDQCHTDLMQLVDDNNNPVIANNANINDFKSQMYPRYNCGIWSLNAFRDIKNSNDEYNYINKTPLQSRHIGYKYSQEDSLIYGKYIVLRLIYWNKRFKLENVELKVNNYGKVS